MSGLVVTRAQAGDLDPALDDLTQILHQSVHAGASVGFVLPFGIEDARTFWLDRVFPACIGGETWLYLAKEHGRILGTVQMAIAMPPNQPHRVDVAKMLVHPDARRRGIARALLQRLEVDARDLGKTLIVLDTRSGDPAQTLYTSMGFDVAGQIPGYCRNPFEDVYEPTTYMFKVLR